MWGNTHYSMYSCFGSQKTKTENARQPHTHVAYKKTTYVYDHEGIVCVRAALTDRRYNWKSTDKLEPAQNNKVIISQ